MSEKLLSLSLCLILVACASEACKVFLKFKSHPGHPYKIEVVVPALKLKTDRISLIEPEDVQVVKIEGKNCGMEQWLFKTYKRTDGTGWEEASFSKAVLDGDGWIVVTIDDHYTPHLGDRLNVFCSMGSCY